MTDSAQGAAVEGWTFLSDYVVEAANHDAAHRQSWNEGLSALVLAAERGWRPAREQRCVLAVDRALASSAPALTASTPDVWKRLEQARMAASCGIPIQNFDASTVLQNLDERLTFLAYLNDEYEADETDFPELGTRHKGTRGEGLCFAHIRQAGLPPSQGDKWIVSQFIRGRALTPA